MLTRTLERANVAQLCIDCVGKGCVLLLLLLKADPDPTLQSLIHSTKSE